MDKQKYFEQIRKETEEIYLENPNDFDNFLRLLDALLRELSQFDKTPDSEIILREETWMQRMKNEAVWSKPKENDEFWCMRNAYFSLGLMNPSNTKTYLAYNLFGIVVAHQQPDNLFNIKSLKRIAKKVKNDLTKCAFTVFIIIYLIVNFEPPGNQRRYLKSAKMEDKNNSDVKSKTGKIGWGIVAIGIVACVGMTFVKSGR